ncbi:MAG: D-2-hydroxyacid dehydrogenase [Pirellulaceae bacterium]|nr:D-2-hydroxyacid dehydrogenase [Pirellulaceae bacterium]
MNIVLGYPVTPAHIAQIQKTFPSEVILSSSQEELPYHLQEADIFCGHAKVPINWRRIVDRGRLQWIQSSAAGLDHCLVPEVVTSEILVSSASGLFANQVAEQTLALLYGLIRRIPTFVKAQRKKRFQRLPTDDLHGKTIGIVGFGGNGRRIAELLAPLGNRIIASDYFLSEDFPGGKPPSIAELFHFEEMDRLLEQSEVVIVTVPLNKKTFHLFSKRQFAKMREGAIFINVARGQVVDEVALVGALESGQVALAGLDVTEAEPLPPQSPLWESDQVLITPHVGAQSKQRVSVTTDFFCENLKRFLQNVPLLNSVNKELGFPHPRDHVLFSWKK